MRYVALGVFALLLVACPEKKKAPPAPPAPSPTTKTSTGPASQPASKPAALGTPNLDNPTNVSGINPKGDCDGSKPCKCVGILKYGNSALEKIGVTPATLTEGAPCLLGDYDGNGFMDIAFFGKTFGEVVADKPSKADVTVLMFDGLGLRQVSTIPGKVQTLAVQRKYPVSEKHVQDGLYDPGDEKRMLYLLSGKRFGVKKR